MEEILDDLWKKRHKEQYDFNEYCDSLILIDGEYRDENDDVHFYIKDKKIEIEIIFRYFLVDKITLKELFTNYGKIEFDDINYKNQFFKSCVQVAARTICFDLVPVIPMTLNKNLFCDINCVIVYKHGTDFS